jgi:formate hydrogenlyase transcriptional activator
MRTLNVESSFEHRAVDPTFENIVGCSPALKSVLAEAEQVAPTDSTVLVLGETGTGKELIARAIHEMSSRRGRPLIKLNCAAIPSDLLESELFGHERGAFTGAITQRIGRFEMADTGTLFLDEIGDIPLALQPKLLRVLQEQEFERLGSGTTHRVNVRLIAATHRNLVNMVSEREFRSDLYYRLNVFPIELPPLRKRVEDIPQLVSHFVEIYARRMHKRIDHLPDETLAAFQAHSWPGNVRELQNMVERAVIMSNDGELPNPLPHACPQSSRAIRLDRDPMPNTEDRFAVDLNQTGALLSQGTLRNYQKVLILQALQASGWVIGGPGGAASQLGLKRTTLIAKMRSFGISRPTPQFKLGEGIFGSNDESQEQSVAD